MLCDLMLTTSLGVRYSVSPTFCKNGEGGYTCFASGFMHHMDGVLLYTNHGSLQLWTDPDSSHALQDFVQQSDYTGKLVKEQSGLNMHTPIYTPYDVQLSAVADRWRTGWCKGVDRGLSLLQLWSTGALAPSCLCNDQAKEIGDQVSWDTL